MRALAATSCALWLFLSAPLVQASEQGPSAADANATFVLPLSAPAHERPAHRIGLGIGGSYPAAATLAANGMLGVAPLTAGRLSVLGLYHTQMTADGRRHHLQPVVLLGPAAVFDMLRYVPHVFVQGGIAVLPVAPVIAFGASIEQFFSLRTSAVATLQGVWQNGFGLRVEAQMGVFFSSL